MRVGVVLEIWKGLREIVSSEKNIFKYKNIFLMELE
jgi:hypothetical protein